VCDGRQPGSHSVSPSRVQVKNSLQADSQLRVAVAEAGDSSETQRKGKVCCWKLLPSSAVKTMAENTSLCVIAICKV
jgi:hypothetical protein